MRKAGGGLILAGVILLVAAILVAVIGIWMGASGAMDYAESIKPFSAPGETTVEVDEPGDYRIFSESGALPSDVAVTVTSPSGTSLELRPNTSETYGFDNRQGASIYGFRADAPGTYTVTATSEGSTAQLAVGPSIMSAAGSLFGILGGVCLGALLGVVGLVLLIIGIVKRSG